MLADFIERWASSAGLNGIVSFRHQVFVIAKHFCYIFSASCVIAIMSHPVSIWKSTQQNGVAHKWHQRTLVSLHFKTSPFLPDRVRECTLISAWHKDTSNTNSESIWWPGETDHREIPYGKRLRIHAVKDKTAQRKDESDKKNLLFLSQMKDSVDLGSTALAWEISSIDSREAGSSVDFFDNKITTQKCSKLLNKAR